MSSRRLLLPVSLLLASMLTGSQQSVSAATAKICFACTNSDCGGACSCFANFGDTCTSSAGTINANKTCGALGEQ